MPFVNPLILPTRKMTAQVWPPRQNQQPARKKTPQRQTQKPARRSNSGKR